MQENIIIALLVILAIESILFYRQGKLLDKISAKYISDHNSLRSFAKVYLSEK